MAGLPRSRIVGADFSGEVHARAVRASGGVLAAVARLDAESSGTAGIETGLQVVERTLRPLLVA